MKLQLKKIIIVCLLCLPIIANGQWGTIGTIGRTLPPFVGIGIGQFPTVPSLNARLHVNNFLLGAPNGPLNGFLFRTDGDQSVVNQWQLFTGTSATAQTLRFRLFVPANDSCVIVKSTTSSLILADSKTQISVQELKAMQEQIALLQQQLAILQKELDKLKTKN
jgi:hypothetical protein